MTSYLYVLGISVNRTVHADIANVFPFQAHVNASSNRKRIEALYDWMKQRVLLAESKPPTPRRGRAPSEAEKRG